jgi:hypothetical protein
MITISVELLQHVLIRDKNISFLISYLAITNRFWIGRSEQTFNDCTVLCIAMLGHISLFSFFFRMPIQAPQWTEFLSCPVCCNEFDPTLRSPISLGCGHTVCKTCLSNLHRKQCPFDQVNCY